MTTGSVTWSLTWEDVTVEIIATENADGDIVFTYELVSGTADLNGFYIDIGNDGGPLSDLGGGNNMNGSDSDGDSLNGFEIAVEIGTVGGSDPDTTSGTLTFTKAELGIISLEELALAEIGIRATSVGDDREGSLKLADTGVYHEDPSNEEEDNFPEWKQDISNMTFVFNQTEGDRNGDGYYTVKIDVPEDLGDDPDAYIDDLLAAMIAADPNLDADADLMGVVIKGGRQKTDYFAYGDYNNNGSDPDVLPAGIGFALPGNHRNVNVREIDSSMELSLSGDDFLFV